MKKLFLLNMLLYPLIALGMENNNSANQDNAKPIASLKEQATKTIINHFSTIVALYKDDESFKTQPFPKDSLERIISTIDQPTFIKNSDYLVGLLKNNWLHDSTKKLILDRCKNDLNLILPLTKVVITLPSERSLSTEIAIAIMKTLTEYMTIKTEDAKEKKLQLCTEAITFFNQVAHQLTDKYKQALLSIIWHCNLYRDVGFEIWIPSSRPLLFEVNPQITKQFFSLFPFKMLTTFTEQEEENMINIFRSPIMKLENDLLLLNQLSKTYKEEYSLLDIHVLPDYLKQVLKNEGSSPIEWVTRIVTTIELCSQAAKKKHRKEITEALVKLKNSSEIQDTSIKNCIETLLLTNLVGATSLNNQKEEQ